MKMDSIRYPRRLLLQEQVEPASCSSSLWDAVSRVDGSIVWKQGLRNSGLDILLQKEYTSGVVMLVQDDGLLGCKVPTWGDKATWPYDECFQAAREWLEMFQTPVGSGLLMYHWLPGASLDGEGRIVVSQDDAGFGTLLDMALARQGNSSEEGPGVLFPSENTVEIPIGTQAKEGELGGYPSAQIVQTVELCDPSRGGVFVLNRPLYPLDLPGASSTSLSSLGGYCDTSVLSYLSAQNEDQDDQIALRTLTSAAYENAQALLNPMLNVTTFSPNFAGNTSNPILYAGFNASLDDVKEVLSFFTLSHFVAGSYCPDDFRNGLTLETVAGTLSGTNSSIYVIQDEEDTNVVHIDLLFGNLPRKNLTARYLGQACHSSVYALDSFFDAWESPASRWPDAKLPFSYLGDLPLVQSQEDLFNVPQMCTSSNMPIPSNLTDSSRLSAGAISGIVLGVVCFVCICVLLVKHSFDRYFRKKVSADDLYEFKISEDNASANSHLPLIREQKISSVSVDSVSVESLTLKDSQVVIDVDPETQSPVVLGQGRFGKVFRGTMLGVQPVAIKCISCLESSEQEPALEGTERKSLSNNVDHPQDDLLGPLQIKHILNEFALLKSCRSDFIVSLLGAMIYEKEIRLVTELMSGGDLWGALGRAIGSQRQVSWYHGGIYIAMDIAAGLTYLHEKLRVVHLDLKSSNVLLRECSDIQGLGQVQGLYNMTHRAKISDVGLSKMLPLSHEYIVSSNIGGTWNWCAPEVILNTKCTSLADMYSYGVVLWEICTGEVPIRGRMRDLRVPDECPQEVSDLIHACTDTDSAMRPSAADAYTTLRNLLQNGKNISSERYETTR